MKTSGRALWIAVAAGLLVAGPGMAQYRTDTPAVLTPPPPPPPPDPNADIRAFRHAYDRAKRPRIAVFWNRELSDKTQAEYVERRTERTTGTVDLNATARRSDFVGPYSRERTASVDASGRMKVDTEETRGKQRTDEAMRPGFSELSDWNFQAAFSTRFERAGATLLDRATIIRATKGTGGPTDPQVAEAAALVGKADLLMEILLSPDQSAPTGFSFRVAVKEVRTGKVVATLVTQADPPKPQGPARYVATPHGFERAQPPTPGVSDVGAQLAAETMQALVMAWGGGK